jgi:hypothetical protein
MRVFEQIVTGAMNEPPKPSAYERVYSQTPTFEEAQSFPDRIGLYSLIALAFGAIISIAGFHYMGQSFSGHDTGFGTFISWFSFIYNIVAFIGAMAASIYGIYHPYSLKTGQPVHRIFCRIAVWWPLIGPVVFTVFWVISLAFS